MTAGYDVATVANAGTYSTVAIRAIGARPRYIDVDDGTLTLDTDGMIDVLQSMKAQLIVPMHFFSSFTLHRFLDVAKNRKWDVEFAPVPTTTV